MDHSSSPPSPDLLYSRRFENNLPSLRINPAHRSNTQQLSPISPGSESPPESAIDEMATMVAQNHVPNMPGSVGGVSKRYRPAPAKTFQCRGYGECRMVFSRSEHLARHIRKHTGERPFTCHCGKQFSRLDNLRQHAQTVHADKQDQNERMMRDLTSLHATMAAANKVTNPRGGRRTGGVNALSSANSNGPNMDLVKQEDMGIPVHQRPGTSTGYEGDHEDIMYHQHPGTWHIQSSDIEHNSSRSASGHSFRDPGQSFLAPSASSTTSSAAAAQSQSFLPISSTFSFSLPDSVRDSRPRSSSSRPPTSSGSAGPHRSLPPLAAVVSASIPPPSYSSASNPNQQHQQSSHHILPFPGSLGLRRPSTASRPGTATRPGTAPASASFFSSKSSYYGGGLGLVSRPELSLQYGRVPAVSDMGSAYGGYDADPPASPTGHDSPFYFHPPDAPITATTSSVPANPRKRAFAGPDGPYDDPPRGQSSHGLDYDYGSESRPQSRRLSVMELCNDSNPQSGVGEFLLSASARLAAGYKGDSRPTTSSGLVSSASSLTIVDRPSPVSGSPLLARVGAPAAGPAQAGRNNSGGAQEFGGGRVLQSVSRRRLSAATPPATSAILSSRSGQPPQRQSPASGFPPSPAFSTSSFSPRSDASFSPRSPVSDASSTAVPRRHADNQHDQVRISVSPHSAAALGMRA